MVKKEIGLEISMQIANRLKNYIYFYNVYIYTQNNIHLVMVLATRNQPEKCIT